jgi:hypothetical protein
MMVNFLLAENETAVHQHRCLKCASTAGEVVPGPVISTIKDNHKGRVLRKPILEHPSLKNPNERRCYGCGHVGHLRGDPECSAVDKAVWIGAPERFKRKMEEGVPPLFIRGERKDGSNRQKLWNKVRRKEAPKLPCRNWLGGKGSCKYAKRCHYSHDLLRGKSAKGTAAGVPKQREEQYENNCATIDVTDLSEEDVLVNVKGTSVPWRTEWDKEYHQYQRIRGKPAVIGRKDTPTIRDDFMQKAMNLIEPSNFIGSKIL